MNKALMPTDQRFIYKIDQFTEKMNPRGPLQSLK
jgi:hypothetical protein